MTSLVSSQNWFIWQRSFSHFPLIKIYFRNKDIFHHQPKLLGNYEKFSLPFLLKLFCSMKKWNKTIKMKFNNSVKYKEKYLRVLCVLSLAKNRNLSQKKKKLSVYLNSNEIKIFITVILLWRRSWNWMKRKQLKSWSI